ncbi:MAG: Asp23/Gls24 family envelope stress response protein [Ruminiclostridium sp.]|nr:Asp23/Gls24 family envelope stress response protein [Ruminiclostridium sp.]
MTDLVKTQGKDDKIRISDDVIATIAGMAASEIESLASMSGGLKDGIAGVFGRKNFGKGIKVEIKENEVVIELSIIMQYGCKIHEVSRQIQERVRLAVENMTGMVVMAININVLGVSVGKDIVKIEMVDDKSLQPE